MEPVEYIFFIWNIKRYLVWQFVKTMPSKPNRFILHETLQEYNLSNDYRGDAKGHFMTYCSLDDWIKTLRFRGSDYNNVEED